MKIRALTLGQDLFLDDNQLHDIKQNLIHLNELKEIFLQEGIEVEYVRFAAPPFSDTTDMNSLYHNPEPALDYLDSLVKEKLLGIYSFCPGLCAQSGPLTISQTKLLHQLPDLLKKHPDMFSSIQVANTSEGIHFEALKAGIKIIQSMAEPDPIKNVQFALTANVPPNTPFFPSAYYQGETPLLTIALEAADELNKILTQFPSSEYSLKEIQAQIKVQFEAIYDQIEEIAQKFCEPKGIKFGGMDLSPAPYPTFEKSIGTALEKVGLSKFGGVGSVFSVGFLTQALQSVERPKIGFSGFMQPLLEDSTIALRNNEGYVDLSKLLLYSTMCGLGLDCIPIPGNTPSETIELLLMDLFMISMRLNKPLTARLMPIPGKQAGDYTQFNFEYFTDSEILSLAKSTNFDFQKFHNKNIRYFF